MIFLDTHVLVRLLDKNSPPLPEKTQKLIEENDCFISPMVRLELEYLYEIKRISKSSSTIIKSLVRDIFLQEASDSLQHIAELAVSEKWTRDPFDRIIVSHAKFYQAQLISIDRNIQKNYSLTRW